MHPVTIDNLDIKIHTRYALDQQTLDPKFIEEVPLIPSLSEIASLSSIYSLEFEKLFGLNIKNKSWAFFSPPAKFISQKNRFFSHRLILGILGTEVIEEDINEEASAIEEAEFSSAEVLTKELITKAASVQKQGTQNKRAFENERTTVINLLSMIKNLNQILEECNAKRLQYQKG